MSAFIVSLEQIEVLAAVSVHQNYRGGDFVGEVVRTAKLLWKENHKSVNYRYQENTRTPSIKAKDFDYYQDLIKKYNNMQVYKLAQCYDYQTCEHPTYKKSKAYAIINAIETRMASYIIGDLSAYEMARWSL